MNIRQIEVFLAVVRQGGFSAAADQLCIAQSAVSIAIRRLEEDLGARLIERTSRSVELTAAGQTYLARVQPALAQLALARQEVHDMENGTSGPVVMAAPAMVTQFALAQPLVSFQLKHPRVQVRLRQGGAAEIERWVLAGDVELGVVAGGETSPALAVEVLARFPNVACVAKGAALAKARRLSWKQFLQQPLVAFPVGYHQRRLIDEQARRYGLAPRIVMESESAAVLMEAVRRGVGATTVPLPMARAAPGVVAVSMAEHEVLAVVVCHRLDYALSKAARALLDHLGNAMRQS